MFVLSLVKKHYRLQFYMVCISQVTLSPTASYPPELLSSSILLLTSLLFCPSEKVLKSAPGL